MSAAEIILRIGSGIAGWLVFTGHALVIAALRRADCDPSSDEMWTGTLLLAGVSAGALALVGLGLRWRASLRWLALPAAALALYAAIGIAPALASTSIDGASLCGVTAAGAASSAPATALQCAWPVAQLAVLAIGCAQGVRYWRTHEEDR